MRPTTGTEDLLRLHAPQVLGALVRRYRHFDAAEDAVQEALRAAAGPWPSAGVPGNPRGWLIEVAAPGLTDTLRAEEARRAREGGGVERARQGGRRPCAAGLAELDALPGESDHRLDAVRGHLLESGVVRPGACAGYESVAGKILSLPEQRCMQGRAARLRP